jgi:hypothetical protein
MPKLIAVATLVMGVMFCAAQTSPASAQVMKNFSWKKKPAKAKPQDARAPEPPEAGIKQVPASKRRATKPIH